MQVSSRLVRLRDRLGDAGADALLVTSLTNVRYLSGFTGSAGMLVVLPTRAVLVTDGRYELQAAAETGVAGAEVDVEVVAASGQRQVLNRLVRGQGVRALGLEAAHVSWARQREMAAGWFDGAELVPTSGLVEGLRRVKDAGELARVEQAAAIADGALDAVLPLLDEAPTEAEVALSLEAEMRRRGASGPSFPTICASGPNGAQPHHRAAQRRIGPGEAVVIDFGAVVDGYCSDVTRTVWVGELAHPDLRRAVAVVSASQAAGVAAVREGRACRDVDRACREVIDDAGFGPRFVHGTGHGVGLDVHEAPSVATTSTDTLSAGHVVTVEPGVYLPGVGGVRIEDTVVVTDAGCLTVTRAPKDVP